MGDIDLFFKVTEANSGKFVILIPRFLQFVGGGPRVVVSTAAFNGRVRGLLPDLSSLKDTKMFLPHPLVTLSIVGSLCDREVACSASDLQGLNFKSCVWRAVSSHSNHHPQEVLPAKFNLYVHKSGLKPDSFHFFLTICILRNSLNVITCHSLWDYTGWQ